MSRKKKKRGAENLSCPVIYLCYSDIPRLGKYQESRSLCYPNTHNFRLTHEIVKTENIERLTTYSSIGCPLTVQQQANDPIRMIRAPVPIKTYGAVLENSVLTSMYLYSSTSIHMPVTRTAIPDNFNHNMFLVKNTDVSNMKCFLAATG